MQPGEYVAGRTVPNARDIDTPPTTGYKRPIILEEEFA